jgi:type I restriction enzyme, S subunit
VKTKQKPEVHFEKSKENWKEFKAGSIFYSVSDKNHTELPVLSASQEKGMVFRDQIGIDIQYNVESTKSYKRVTPGQFVIHLRSFQGGFAFSDIEGITSPAYTVLDFKDKEIHNSLFWKNVLSSRKFIKRLETVTYGIRDGRSISFSDFSTLKFRVPNYEEQTKIGNFFKQLDDTIALHQQELTTLKQAKQGFLQKMFPKEGESVPEVRFPGFTGDWEQRTLGEVLKVNSGRDYKHLQQGNIPVYGTGGYMLSVNKKLSDLDAIGIGRKGTIDKPQLLKAPFWTVDTLFYMTVKEENDLLYCYTIANKIQWKKYDESTGVPSLSKSSIDKISISIPTSEEQSKIGKFFKQLDDTIALHERELDSLKETKKAFLQKMFV